MKKLLFVMNPYAGMRRANRFLTDILSLFNGRGYEVTVHMTAGPGDGAGLWRPWPDVRIWWSVPVETAPSMRR